MPPERHIPCQIARLRPIDDPDPDVLAHRQTCSACGQAMESLRASWGALGVVGDREPSPGFNAGVMAKIARTDSNRIAALPSRLGTWRWTVLAGSLAVSLLVASLVWHRERSGSPVSGSEAVAQIELLESQDLLLDLDVVEDLDLLLLMDEG